MYNFNLFWSKFILTWFPYPLSLKFTLEPYYNSKIADISKIETQNGSCSLIWGTHNSNMNILLVWMSPQPPYFVWKMQVSFSELITTTIKYSLCGVKYTLYWTLVKLYGECHICIVNPVFIIQITRLMMIRWVGKVACIGYIRSVQNTYQKT